MYHPVQPFPSQSGGNSGGNNSPASAFMARPHGVSVCNPWKTHYGFVFRAMARPIYSAQGRVPPRASCQSTIKTLLAIRICPRFSRRAFQFRHRARQLTEAAASTWHTEAERRFMLDQAEIFRRVADQIAPPLPSKFFGCIFIASKYVQPRPGLAGPARRPTGRARRRR